MRKTIGVSALVLVVLAAGQASAVASTTPRWTTHARNYPGGISNGVRAYLDSGVSSAKPGLGPVAPSGSAAQRAPLNNLQVNSLDSNPRVPQNETQVVVNPNNPHDCGGGGERLRQRRLADLQDDRWRLPLDHRSSARRPPRRRGDFCGGGGDPALDLQQARPRASTSPSCCFFRVFLRVRGRGDPLDRQRQHLEPVAARRLPDLQLLAEPRRLQPGALLRQGADRRRQQPVEPALRAAVRHLRQVPHAAERLQRLLPGPGRLHRQRRPERRRRPARLRPGIARRSCRTTRATTAPARRPTRARSRLSTTRAASTSPT